MTLYVLLGISILTGLNFLATLAFVYFYNFVAKVAAPSKEVIHMVITLTLANALTQFLCLITFITAGTVIYPLATAILSIGGYFLIMHYYYKMHIFENLIIGISLAIIINPIWLILFGIIR